MAIRDSLLPDFDQEMAATRGVLCCVPDPLLSWKPHPKSFSMGELASHIARIPRWGETILDRDFYDVAQGTARPYEESPRTIVIATFDGHVSSVRRRLIERTDAELLAPWSLKKGAHTLMTMPRLTAIRRYVLHHIIHHRGQLTVYLRLQDVALPALYGASADQQM